MSGERSLRIVATCQQFEVESRIQLRTTDNGFNLLIGDVRRDDVIVELFLHFDFDAAATFRSCRQFAFDGFNPLLPDRVIGRFDRFLLSGVVDRLGLSLLLSFFNERHHVLDAFLNLATSFE